MKTYEKRYFPRQVQLCSLARAATIVALDGPLRLRYSDRSLAWLDVAAQTLVELGEGERHELPFAAWVEIMATGREPVRAVIVCPPSWAARARTALSPIRFRLFGHSPHRNP